MLTVVLLETIGMVLNVPPVTKTVPIALLPLMINLKMVLTVVFALVLTVPLVTVTVVLLVTTITS
jgi:energy-converting hydrogenase Eha subunit C